MLYEGKTEQEIIDELENPRDIARNILNEYGYRPVQNKGNAVEMSEQPEQFNFVKIFLILLFDLLIVTWLVPTLFGIMVSLAGSLGAFLTTLQFSTEFGALSIFYGMLVIGIAFLWLLLVLWFYDIFIGFIVWLVRWHMQVFHIRDQKQVIRFLNRFKVSRLMRKQPTLNRVKNRLKSLSAVMVIIGGIGTLWLAGSLFIGHDHSLETYSYSIETTDDGPWSISAQMDLGNIIVRYHDEDTVWVEGELTDRVETTIDIDETNRTITITNAFSFPGFTFNLFGSLWNDQGELTVYLPRDTVLENVEIESTNSALDFNGITIESFTVQTTNGSITLQEVTFNQPASAQTTNGSYNVRAVHAESLSLTTTNGRITIRDSVISDLDVKTTNGKIDVNGLNEDAQDGLLVNARSTNGKIEFQNVYALEAYLKTTNGDIDYDNDDRSFYLDHVEGTTTNGSVRILVPRN